jgi:hypothetical protein
VTLLRPAVLYQDDAITVTTAFLELAGQRYPLDELDLLRRVEHAGWLRPRLYELSARFRGRTVRLFRSRDAREFGRVCRALVRARERAGLV